MPGNAPSESISKRDIKPFEELEKDAEKLYRSQMDHERDVAERRMIDLDHIRKLLKFYKVRHDEIADALYSEENQGNFSNDPWSRR
jgi:hypothetical protein